MFYNGERDPLVPTSQKLAWWDNLRYRLHGSLLLGVDKFVVEVCVCVCFSLPLYLCLSIYLSI